MSKKITAIKATATTMEEKDRSPRTGTVVPRHPSETSPAPQNTELENHWIEI